MALVTSPSRPQSCCSCLLCVPCSRARLPHLQLYGHGGATGKHRRGARRRRHPVPSDGAAAVRQEGAFLYKARSWTQDSTIHAHGTGQKMCLPPPSYVLQTTTWTGSGDSCGTLCLQVTVSTVGLVPEMQRFSRSSRAQLAVSLHATTDEVSSMSLY